MSYSGSGVIVDADIRAYFHERIDAALSTQAVQVEASTAAYLVNLLSAYTHARELFEKTEDGFGIKPLALHYADAIYANSAMEKSAALKKLGDIALFISGLFAGSLSRKLVDVDYYIAMGGSAYSGVHDLLPKARDLEENRSTYADLAENFSALVDVLAAVGESSNLNSNSDVLRAYEIWLKTGSTRAEEKLRRHGIVPSFSSTSRATH